MKAILTEYEGCYSIHLFAETIEEASRIVRMGIDHIKEVRGVHAYASNDGTVEGSVTIGKSKVANNYVPRRSGRP